MSVSEAPVFAQERTAEETTEVLVTGSRIRRAQEEGPSPIVSITSEELDARGYNTLLEALNDVPQNAGGGFDQQSTTGFAPSASAVDIRGFGVGRSLVLIDGRRVPVFPLAQSGTDNFVDLSSIPVAAIERIDVVTTGASAVYGSDAVSGVINIVLKRNTDNEISVRRSDTTDGGGQTRVQFATGLENEAFGSALVFAEYFKHDRMMFADRDYSRSDVLGGIGGSGAGIFSSFGNPGTFLGVDDSLTPASNCDTSGGSPGIQEGFCRFNRAQYRELIPAMEHFSLTGKLERPIVEQVSFFTRATYLNSKVRTEFEPVGADTDIVPGTNPNNPAGVDGVWFRRMVEFGPRAEDIENDTYNVVAGLRGDFGRSYNWELGVQYAEQRITSFNRGFLRSAGLDQAVTTGVVDLNGDGALDPINLFDPIPQPVVDAIGVRPRTDGLSTLTSADLQLNGELFDLPGGPARFAVFSEFVRQQFEDRRDPEVLAGDIEGLGGTSGAGSRKYSALGVELEIPIVSTLTMNLAGRYDNYDDASDVGGAFSPRVALQFRPIRQVLLRASAGRSFRAPDLQRLFGAETAAFDDLIDTPTCIAQGGAGRGDTSVASCVTPVQAVEIRTGANVKLSEEKGDNYNFGVVVDPLPGLSISTDFWYIKLEKIVNTPTEQFILDQNAATGGFSDAIQRETVGCDPSRNPGCLEIVSSQARNLSFQRARGVDTEIRYAFDAGEAGAFTFKLGSSYLDRLEIQELPGDAVIDVLTAGELGEFVRFKGNAAAAWRLGPWSSTVFVNHIGSFTPEDPTTVSKVGSYTTVNVSGSYAMPWNGAIHLGVNNIFDRDPPLDLSDGTSAQPFYNQYFHDPYGRTWWAGYVQRF
jgi:iron complex outermembrane receptor protein